MNIPPEKRFSAQLYRSQDCDAAIRGERVPEALGDKVVQACVVRGIRYHSGFAGELDHTLPLFTRALNARRIMDNIIPEMTEPESFPYCIWHPVVASRETYRQLAQRYPQMRYQVGRACAVAGYNDLYSELKLVPDVHIAEEARDNGSMDIFEQIMAQPKYSIMDDYNRSVNEKQPHLVQLNGDTAVRSTLERKQKHEKSLRGNVKLPYHYYFNITEDFNYDEFDSPRPDLKSTVSWLYNPLPPDLPAVHKDILILMAAYYGDVDRYARLRRPKPILKEQNCIIRGIYHNTMFAKWWSLQPLESHIQYRTIRAINARFIMNNDLSRISPTTPAAELPYCIWFPTLPEWNTLTALARRRPDMKHSVTRACIIANFQDLYDELNADPDEALVIEARASVNKHYLEDLERKMAAGRKGQPVGSAGWKKYTRKEAFERTSSWLHDTIGLEQVGVDFGFMYDGSTADVGQIELYVCAADVVREEPEKAELLKANGFLDLSELYELEALT